jgi:hypothetical protein
MKSVQALEIKLVNGCDDGIVHNEACQGEEGGAQKPQRCHNAESSCKRVPNSPAIGQVVTKLLCRCISGVDLHTEKSVPAQWSEGALVVQEFLDALATYMGHGELVTCLRGS